MKGWIVLLLAGVAACADNTDVDPFVGRWFLQTINGQALPTSGQILTDTVLLGRLQIFDQGGFPIWQRCDRENAGNKVFRGGDQMRYVRGDPGDQDAELVTTFPLSSPTDTITVSGDALTWEYNQASDPGSATDLLTFRRLADGAATDPVCTLTP